MTQSKRHFDTPVEVTYRFGKPDKRQRDLGNLEKAPSDLLVAHGILKDDSLIHRMILEWADLQGMEAEIRTVDLSGETPILHIPRP